MSDELTPKRLYVTTSIGMMRLYFGVAVLLLSVPLTFLFEALLSAKWAQAASPVPLIGAALVLGWVSTRLAQVCLVPEGIEVKRLFGRTLKPAEAFHRVEAFGSLIRIRFHDGSAAVYGIANQNFTDDMIPRQYLEAADKEWAGWLPRPVLWRHRAYIELLRERGDIALINQRIQAWMDSRVSESEATT